MPRIATDDHAAGARIGHVGEQVVGEAGGNAAHQHAVHAIWAGAEHAAQAGGAELQGHAEAIGELLERLVVARVDFVDQRSEFVARLGVVVVGQPRIRGSDE